MWSVWGNPELTLEGQVQVEVLGQKPLLGLNGNFRPPRSVARMSCGFWDALSPSLPSSEVAAKIPDPGVRQASPSEQVKSPKIPLPFYLTPASLPHSCPLQFILRPAARALPKPKPVIPLARSPAGASHHSQNKMPTPPGPVPMPDKALHDLAPPCPPFPTPVPLAPSAKPHQPSGRPKHAKSHIPVSGSLHLLFLCSELTTPTSLPSYPLLILRTRLDVTSFLAHPFE